MAEVWAAARGCRSHLAVQRLITTIVSLAEVRLKVKGGERLYLAGIMCCSAHRESGVYGSLCVFLGDASRLRSITCVPRLLEEAISGESKELFLTLLPTP